MEAEGPSCHGRASRVTTPRRSLNAEGAVTVRLAVDDLANEDTFQRANITGSVKTPECEFHVYNVKFACQVVRAIRVLLTASRMAADGTSATLRSAALMSDLGTRADRRPHLLGC